MSFPPSVAGDNGWEPLGKLALTDDQPLVRPLPATDIAIYYDPVPLGGVGDALEDVIETFALATVLAVHRGDSVEVRLRQPNVYGVALLDALVVPPPRCALILDVFNDDRTTIRWSVGTSDVDPFPYLIEPDNYAQQEIDVASGSATISTVSVVIIDPAQTAGDQQSGWMTERLADLGLADIQGRRCRLRRFISDEVGYQVLADGPAGTPAMDASYAAFGFEIRDTRDTERKIQIFGTGGGISAADALDLTSAPQGAKVILPDSVIGGYGHEPIGGTYLIPPTSGPLLGRFVRLHVITELFILPGHTPPNEGPWACGQIDLLATPGNSDALRQLSDGGYKATQGQDIAPPQLTGAGFGAFRRDFRFPNIAVLWRAAGTLDPWTELGPSTLRFEGQFFDMDTFHLVLVDTSTPPKAVRLYMGDVRGSAFLPADGEDIEFYVVYRGAPSTDIPLYVEGMTAGEFARNVYAGQYSARDRMGAVVPTGIQFDEIALLQMTELIRLRLTEPITDARDFLEKSIYAPLGMAPALDNSGLISPVSQAPPTDTSTLAIIANAITEPSADWNAGDRIINKVSYTYPRDYRPTDPANAQTGDGLASVAVTIEFDDPVSMARNGIQELDIDGSAFRAIGAPDGSSIISALANSEAALSSVLAAAIETASSAHASASAIQTALNAAIAAHDSDAEIQALSTALAGQTAQAARDDAAVTVLRAQLAALTATDTGSSPEPGPALAGERGANLLNRYSLGAAAISIPCMRSATALLRAGDWVLLDLSWLPDYITQRRGLLALGQIVSLGDLDCAWRQLLVEQVVPPGEPGYS